MLIDEVLNSDFKDQQLSNAGLQEKLLRAVVIKAQNVADYMFEQTSEAWSIQKDFPNVAPPMPFMWIEWKMPNKEFQDDEALASIAGLTFGTLIQAIDLNEEKDLPVKPLVMPYRWGCSGSIFMQISNDRTLWMGTLSWLVSEKGEFFLKDNKLDVAYDPRLTNGTSFEGSKLAHTIRFSLNVPLLTLTFMHCKNVRVQQSEKWPDKLQHSREKKGKRPLLRWHTLVIDPVKKIVASMNNGNPTLTPKALHICRGHFKDFSEKGLFGKYRGMYWWPMHTRGSAEHGVIGKDYLVKPDIKPETAVPKKD